MSASVPPPVLNDFRVLEYAIVDSTVQFTGRQNLYANDEKIGAVPRLAICEHLFNGDLVMLHCDAEWGVLAVQAWNSSSGSTPLSIGEIKQRAERAYAGVSGKWTTLGIAGAG